MGNNVLINSGRIEPFFSTRWRLVESITSSGHKVSLGTFTKGYKQVCEQKGLGYEYIHFSRAGFNPFADIKTLYSYYQSMKRGEYDIVHSYTVKPNIYGSIAARLAGIKRVYPTINGLGYAFSDVDQGAFKAFVTRNIVVLLYRIAFSSVDKVFFQNSDDLSELVSRRVLDKNKCVLISGSGIDLEAFHYSEPPVEPITFLFASRLLISKGVRTYCEAARMLHDEYSNARFLLAGSIDPNPDGMSEEELNRYIEEGAVEYLGVVENMQQALTSCSVFVLPSFYREGVPHAILEAMSTGRAVITTDSPGCRETIQSADESGLGKNGFLIKPRNSNELAQRMRAFIHSPSLVQEMGEASRKYAEERFDVELVNKIILQTMGLM